MENLLARTHNPDVLTCIANLSNDEVFTPPEIATAMLDMVADAWATDHDGESLWSNPNVTFLDPFTKTGVFLREITRRLVEGLEAQIPDLQERVNHVLTRQVYGIAITELTALMARQSVYCSKRADGEHAICTGFDTPNGNIWFERTEHTWTGGTRESRVDPLTGDEIFVYTNRKCSYCGAGENDYGRGDDLETHAYAFIHTDNITQRINEIFGAAMHFDIVIGNPPYQLSDGGFGKSAAPIYHEFVEQAKALDPRYLTMIIPSRWFSGGKGLDDFRDTMLNDDRLRSITDYLNASDVFAGIGLKGGVCYFLWNRDNRGECTVTTHFKDHDPSVATRPLLETGADTFIRFNQGVTILRKVLSAEPDPDFASLVSARKPFGLTTTFQGKSKPSGDDSVLVYQNGGTGYVGRDEVQSGTEWIDAWKIFVSYAAPGTGNRDTYPHRIISTPFIGQPGEISTETYLAIGPFETRTEVDSALSYLKCRFTRFLILLHKASQHVTKKVYSFVPQQSWDRTWTDEELYAKYGLTDEEIAFIESIVRPMEDD